MNKRVVILAEGDPPKKRTLVEYLRKAHFFICADGGANIAAKMKLRPNLIIGDLDSVDKKTIRIFKHIKTRMIKDQNTTDLEKALSYSTRNKYTEIFVFSGIGKRIDHTIANLSALIKYSYRADISFILNEGKILPVLWERKLNIPVGTTISLIPLTLCEGISTTGLKWNLNDDFLCLGSRESVSNVATSSHVTIKFRRGNLVAFIANPTLKTQIKSKK